MSKVEENGENHQASTCQHPVRWLKSGLGSFHSQHTQTHTCSCVPRESIRKLSSRSQAQIIQTLRHSTLSPFRRSSFAKIRERLGWLCDVCMASIARLRKQWNLGSALLGLMHLRCWHSAKTKKQKVFHLANLDCLESKWKKLFPQQISLSRKRRRQNEDVHGRMWRGWIWLHAHLRRNYDPWITITMITSK